MAVEDVVELGVVGVSPVSGEKVAGVRIAGSDVVSTKKDGFTSDGDRLIVAITGHVDRGYEGAGGIELIRVGEIKGWVPGDFGSGERRGKKEDSCGEG